MRVLIAEDDPVIAMGLVARLESLAHEVLPPASDGERAVQAARDHRPDLYLFDIDLPRLDGLAAARRLAEEGLRRPVVAITGVDDPALVERSAEVGADAFLTKPIDERELDAAIRLAAGRHAELEALEAEVARAREALEERKLVEHAKGILIEALGLSEPEALRRMRRLARDRNATLPEVARAVIEQRELLTPNKGRE
jgi:response regulator NasT